MNLRRTLPVAMLLALFLGASGCKSIGRKKPNLPPQASAPTIQPQPTPNQPGPPPPITSEPARPLPTPGEAVAVDNTPKPLPKPKTHIARKTVPPPPPAPAEPAPKPPSPNETQPQPGLAPSISHDDALRRKMDTAQLIESAESKLRNVNRALNSNEQATVQHIRSFIKQAQNATTDGDYERAYNLAQKAHILSDELTKK